MKKLYTTLLTLTAALSLSAQQLPNAEFEQAWVTCYPWTSSTNNTSKTKAQGTTPTSWNVSNTIGANGSGSKTIATQVDGVSGKAVQVTNSQITVFTVTQTVPGYFTLGTPWSTSVLNKNNDGGTFGGIAFAYRPDALSFQYKSANNADNHTVLAYSWKGEFQQANVPADIKIAGSATKVTMIDRDRNILGMTTSQGGDVIKEGTLVSSINQSVSTSTTWASIELPFEYKTTDTPEKINVIFSAGDYFNASPVKDASITVDNVKLLYYSRLESLSINGTDVEGFNHSIYNYDLSTVEMPADASAFTYTLLSNSGSSSAEIALDNENKTATITVTNSNNGGTDVDGQTSHTYVINFKKEEEEKPEYGGDVYDGTVTVMPIEEVGSEQVDVAGSVHIIKTDDNTCTFVLPDFALGDDAASRLGDIIVENVTMTATENGYSYQGTKKGLLLKFGENDIVANVVLEGTTDNNGVAKMQIHVVWIMDPENDPEGTNGINIEVEFNGQRNVAGIDKIEIDNSDKPVEYFNIQGMRVDGKNLTPGIYIRRQGSDIRKIQVK